MIGAMRSWLGWARSLSLRTRWLLTISVYALVITAVVIVVRSGGGSGASGGSGGAEATAVAEADREGRIAIAEDEAPHSATLTRGAPLPKALERAISADVHARIARRQLTGPLQSVSCTLGAQGRDGRRRLSCTVRSAGIDYPFVGVADERTRELTWCKVDPPPVSGAPLEVPVSASCRA